MEPVPHIVYHHAGLLKGTNASAIHLPTPPRCHFFLFTTIGWT